jgi:hypothetical protein
MTDERVVYYTITGLGRNPTEPSGLVRRRFSEGGRIDEALRKDMTWERDTAIIEWEYGNLTGTLKEVSEAEAGELIERFRVRWGGGG